MKKDNINFLEKLLETPTPSGNEYPGVELFKSHVSQFGTHLFTDKMGNSVFWKGAKDGHKVLVSGHIDSICGLVTKVLDSGYLQFMSGGGLDRKVLPGSKITILREDGETMTGVIGKKPIHIEHGTPEYTEVSKFDSLLIDTGYGKEDLEAMGVGVGSYVIYQRGQSNLYFGKGGNLICSPDIDDKIGVYIAAEVLRRVDEDKLKSSGICLMCAAMTQDEVGLRGSSIGAARIDPELSIDIDVTFDTDKDMGINQAEEGEIYVGKGPVITLGADKSRYIAHEMKKIAQKEELPYQINITMPGGTNTDAIQLRSTDCETMHVAIPLKNMHTPVEIVSWDDVENCIVLITKYIESL